MTEPKRRRQFRGSGDVVQSRRHSRDRLYTTTLSLEAEINPGERIGVSGRNNITTQTREYKGYDTNDETNVPNL